MRFILYIALILAPIPQLQAQILASILGGSGPAIAKPVDSNTGGGCTGSSGAWTCTGAPTITLTDASALAIYYSTSGTPSCPSTGTLYTSPFTGPSSTFTLQAIGCNGITGGAVLTSVYTISGSSVSVVTSGILTTFSGSCNSGCASPYIAGYTSFVVQNTGDTIVLGTTICSDASCAASQNSSTISWTASDGTNTYTHQSSCDSYPSAVSVRVNATCFIANNVTAGTYTLNITTTVTAAGNKAYYPDLMYVELSGGNASAPADTNITTSGPGAGGDTGSISLTSPGNVSEANEVGLVFFYSQNALTYTGVFSALQARNTTCNCGIGSISNPTSGSTLTFSGTQTSGSHSESMVAIKW